jgi:hypothetical protein
MRSLQDEIRQAQQDLSCPICGRMFNLRDIRVRSYLNNGAVELSVICSRNHFPVILIVPVSLKEASQAGPISESELKYVHKRIDTVRTSIIELLKDKK